LTAFFFLKQEQIKTYIEDWGSCDAVK